MRFPRIHLATSVVNRIMDIHKGVQQMPVITEPPQLVSETRGAQLDKQLATPPQAVAGPAGADAEIAAEIAQGGSAADAVGNMAALDALS